MGIIRFTISIIIVFIGLAAFAQQDNASKFFLGKKYVQEGRNNLAMEVLKPLADFDPKNEYREQAAYLYSVAAINDSLYFQARQILLQIITRYSNWKNIDEARYLIGICYFHAGDPVIALNHYSQIKDERLIRKSEDVKAYYLNSYSDMAILDSLNRLFPSDRAIAFRFAELLSEKGRTDKDLALLESIIDIFKFSPLQFNKSTPDQMVFKDVYNISVLLPFKYASVKSRVQYDKNKFAFEFYTGLLKAIDTLNKDSMRFSVNSFDTEGDTTRLKEILSKKILKESDLIIGPLYPDLSEMVFNYSKQNKIICINPFSRNEEVLLDNNYGYLFQNTYQQTSRLLTQFAIDSLFDDSDTLIQNVLIMDKTHLDSLNADVYCKYLKSKGFKIDTSIVLDIPNRAQFFELFNDTSELNTYDNMFITNSDRVISGRIISALEASGSEMKILGFAEWLDYDNVDLDQMERRHIYFTNPEYIDFDKSVFHWFYESYKFDRMPAFYSMTGFELMMHFGEALKEYGKYFQNGLKNQGFKNGYLYSGVDFSHGNFNAYAPFMKVENAKLLKINYIPEIDYDFEIKYDKMLEEDALNLQKDSTDVEINPDENDQK